MVYTSGRDGISEDDVVDIERYADRANDDGDNEDAYTPDGGL